MSSKSEDLRHRILELVAEYCDEAFAEKTFVPGESAVPVSGKVFDRNELQSLVDSALDFWLTTGRFAAAFEADFSRYLGVDHALLVNSGSSANLVALAGLTSSQLGDRRLKPGDEVITVAAGFPTTVNPILQNGLAPVFVDIDILTYNVIPDLLEQARSEKTRAVMIAHTLGNPFDVERVVEFARRNRLWLVEDCCDALGAEFNGRKVGTFGDLATFSFYPAHHITMGEGGCVVTSQAELKTAVASFRDWGRHCWCEPGHDNTCGRRHQWQLGSLPSGYDHKYTFSHIGYNLKATDMQAAVGVAQMRKLPDFIARRRRNFQILLDGLQDLQELFILPKATEQSNPSWFGFPLFVKPEAPVSRNQVIAHLERHKIATRLLFGGNLVRQPAYQDSVFRIVGSLKNTDLVMERMFWLGVYPGITEAMLDYVLDVLHRLKG
jgi:CDP-6-deoxy-D-xylo-4-hexulose-3-dehydrase